MIRLSELTIFHSKLCTYTCTGDCLGHENDFDRFRAYGRLKARETASESFSETIKRLVPKPIDIATWLSSLPADPVSDQFIAAVEETIAQRRAPQNMKGFDDLPRHNRADRLAKIKSKFAAKRR